MDCMLPPHPAAALRKALFPPMQEKPAHSVTIQHPESVALNSYHILTEGKIL